MNNILDNPVFATRYAQLEQVRLNPHRHTAPNALVHSEQVAALAVKIAIQNGCTEEEITMLENLGRAHDIGKVMGNARPEKSLEVLAHCGPLPQRFLALVKWHDISLPWWKSAQRGQAPSDKAWRRLARETDMRLLCMFMVADRVDAPPGWRRNAPTVWLLNEARHHGLIGDIDLEVDGHPSEVCAGIALTRNRVEKELLLIRVRRDAYELPKGGVEWDELTTAAAIRELQEEASVKGEFQIMGKLGHVEYQVQSPAPETGTHLKRVDYFHVQAPSIEELALPSRTRERIWMSQGQVDSIPLVSEELRPVLLAAFESR